MRSAWLPEWIQEAKNSGSASQPTHYRNDAQSDQREVEPVEPLPVEPEEPAPLESVLEPPDMLPLPDIPPLPDMLPLPDVSELPEVLELPDVPAGLVGLDG